MESLYKFTICLFVLEAQWPDPQWAGKDGSGVTKCGLVWRGHYGGQGSWSDHTWELFESLAGVKQGKCYIYLFCLKLLKHLELHQ